VSVVSSAYEIALQLRSYGGDCGQRAALRALDRCADEWAMQEARGTSMWGRLRRRSEPPRGVYLYGGVGRGKSFLMDCFFSSVACKAKTRLHFHEFMREVHRELVHLQGTVNPLDELAAQIASKYRLICFDEFHVADITDAMILYRLLNALFSRGVGFVGTSNFRPDELYPGGLHRDRILPAIELLNRKLEVVAIGEGTDYRLQAMERLKFYHVPCGEDAEREMGQAFDQLAGAQDEDPVLRIEGREIHARRNAGAIVWFDFAALCDGPRSQNDYLEIATRFQAVFLSNVPCMPLRMASQARRFTWLVDVLYDRRVKLILSAAVPPELLYTQGPLVHEFARTVSRLHEMQSMAYVAQQRRNVDTDLT
jgi:cell division protein ZapE